MHGRCSFHAAVLLLAALAALAALPSLAAGQPWPVCGKGGNYSANSTYEKNLQDLLQGLQANSTSSSSPALFASGASGAAPDAVYGLLLCRGDLSVSDCFDCGTRAIQDVAGACNRTRDVALCYNQCYVRLADTNFLASTNNSGEVPLISGESITSRDVAGYVRAVNDLLDATVRYAVENSTRRFATGKWTGPDPGFPQIYSVAQCTPDLTQALCRSCLQGLVDKWWNVFKHYKNGTGARIAGARCNLRAEMTNTSVYTGSAMVQLPIQAAPALAPSPAASAAGTSNSSTKAIAIILPTIVIVLAVFSLCVWCVRRKIKWSGSGRLLLRPDDHHTTDDLEAVKSNLLSLSSIQAATNNFDKSMKLGEGGFGGVYKGVLFSGQEVAVKRLSKSSSQGIEEVKNELVLVAKLHHKNLVQLVGFCLEEGERLLVYEYMPNKSLDTILFNPEEKVRLNWPKRFNVIEGVAGGLQYLHEDSQEKIVHRDLKASNVLLDASMNPKIGDFGLARLFGQDQTRDVTSHIAGTFGYMSPEYVMCGHFSTKSDVFSFGILVVEIITGLRNSGSYFAERNEDVISTVWRHWEEGTIADMIDDSLGRNYLGSQVIRCLNVALLCLQQNPQDRPTMSEVMVMLDNNNDATLSLPAPSRPTFFIDGTSAYSRPAGGTVTLSYMPRLPVTGLQHSTSSVDTTASSSRSIGQAEVCSN